MPTRSRPWPSKLGLTLPALALSAIACRTTSGPDTTAPDAAPATPPATRHRPSPRSSPPCACGSLPR
ncbi:hypothetical protein G6O69_21465 [Pseudenhygromyxa sp. WMMC2535]|uniref:hypothetical protein n=1 Tax=Pseudenhygromyxa sp. WMMC2535 TaxID=2712867 RepID=UPI0015963002|nr:hypothetical protein [Pseudenhygromyxa sp. WMMC2535]NVB40423.1 hypothetical protein [Pseudenhygromyxa sp. WMMC2535]